MWRSSTEHLIQHGSEAPPVHGLVVTCSDQDLWSDVLRSPTECVGLLAIFDASLGEAKVCELDVTLLIEQDVLRL